MGGEGLGAWRFRGVFDPFGLNRRCRHDFVQVPS